MFNNKKQMSSILRTIVPKEYHAFSTHEGVELLERLQRVGMKSPTRGTRPTVPHTPIIPAFHGMCDILWFYTTQWFWHRDLTQPMASAIPALNPHMIYCGFMPINLQPHEISAPKLSHKTVYLWPRDSTRSLLLHNSYTEIT